MMLPPNEKKKKIVYMANGRLARYYLLPALLILYISDFLIYVFSLYRGVALHLYKVGYDYD
jgi:hypothetical protein